MGSKLRPLLAAVVFLALADTAFGEQITRVGVLDIEKVYSVYFRESRAVKELQEKRAEVLRESGRMEGVGSGHPVRGRSRGLLGHPEQERPVRAVLPFLHQGSGRHREGDPGTGAA